MKKLALALLLIAFGITLGLFMNRTEIKADQSGEKKKIASLPEAKAKVNPAPTQSPQPTMLDNQSKHDWLEPQDSVESSTMQGRQVILHPVRSESVIITTGAPVEYSTTVSGYDVAVGGPIKAVDSGPVNPFWTVGTNGLIQNPCVDPPSANRHLRGQ